MSHDHSLPAAAPRLLLAEDFEPFVGREVGFGDTGVTLVLARLERTSGRHPDLPRAPFVLIFSEARRETYLPEALYRCDFGDDATFDIHVAPMHTAAADQQHYQAIFC